MIKIFVDDKVRSIADDYAKNVFENRGIEFQQPTVLLQNFRTDILERQDDTVGKILCAYVDKIIEKHSDLLHAEPKAMRNLINEFDNILRVVGATRKDKERNLKVLLGKKIKAGEKEQEFHKWIVESMRYDDVRLQIIPYLYRLNIRACVYCNAQYAATVRRIKPRSTKYEATFELDHFYPKSLYPFLCTNFYNLQPCCGACNKHKSNNIGLFNLYTNDVTEDVNPFLFSISHECVISKYLVSKNAEDIEINFDAPNDKALRKNHEKCFHITALYSAFKDVAAEIIWKRKAWNKTYMQMMEGQYNGLDIPAEIQKRIVFGFYPEERDIHLRPLTKLQQDLFKQQDLV